MSFSYPTLSREAAKVEVLKLEQRLSAGIEIVPFPDGGNHPEHRFPSLGGPPVSQGRLQQLHDEVALAAKVSGRTVAERDRLFDLAVGAVLADWFEADGRNNAADPNMWAHLSLVVLPDLAVRRFPASTNGILPSDRFLAGRRNVFYRTYLRTWILGELLRDPELVLYEDDLVGLVDRSLSADHRLARAISREIATIPAGAKRRAATRQGLKRIQFERRVTDFSNLSDRDLSSVVHGSFRD